MNKHFALALAVAAFSTVAVADDVVSDIFQISYAANLNIGDSFVNITNSGATTSAAVGLGLDPVGTSQNLCANLYVFDPAEELISCCTCLVTPNGLLSLSVLKSLVSNPLTPGVPTSAVIKVVADLGCDAATVTLGSVAHGLLAWGTTLQQNTSTASPSYGVTETAFSQAALSPAELTHITSTCGFIQANGSGFGVCSGCPIPPPGITVAPGE